MHAGKQRIGWRRVAGYTGASGAVILVVATLATAAVFSGHGGSAYSILNHKISSLGKPMYSGWATLFNWGLCIGGLLIALFMVALGCYVARYDMLGVVLPGVLMAAGVVTVGICPVTEPQCHEFAATTVFISGVATMFAFTVVVFWLEQPSFPRWLALPSALSVLAFAGFVYILYSQYEYPERAFLQGPPPDNRPILWLPSLFEWLFMSTVVTWVLIIALYLLRRE